MCGVRHRWGIREPFAASFRLDWKGTRGDWKGMAWDTSRSISCTVAYARQTLGSAPTLPYSATCSARTRNLQCLRVYSILSSSSLLSSLLFFCLLRTVAVFQPFLLRTKNRSWSRSYTVHNLVHLPLWEILQHLRSTGPTQDLCPRSCRLYSYHPATWARSYRSYIPYRSYRSGIHLPCLADFDDELYCELYCCSGNRS